MSKSRGNAIFLSDSTDDIRRKLARLYTGRQSTDEPGDPDNVLFQYARAFIADHQRVQELAAHYARGGLGDATIKREVADAIDVLLAPMRERRARFTDDAVLELLREHAARANAVANETLARVKEAMRLDYTADAHARSRRTL
jgi:tryptophanyl-tRNA synthetase